MHVKEQGWILVIDQASNCAGVSLWYNGNLTATTTLVSQSKNDSMARRLQHQVPQLTKFLCDVLPESATIAKILFEGVRARLVLITVGAFLTCPRINAKLTMQSFIGSSSWKKWAKDHGALGPTADVKGVKALSEIGFPVQQHNIESDDVADSILMYLTWKANLK